MKKNKLLIITLLLFFTLSTITITYNLTHEENLFFFLFASTKDKLKKIGYNDEEIKYILNLNDESIYYLKNEYKENILEYINDENFKEENLKLYYSDKNDLKVKDKIKLVNHNDYDINLTYNKLMVDILYDKYYISKNKDRYFKIEDTSSRKVVEKVNTNRDYEYYTNTKKTDTSKGNLMLVNKYYYLDNYNPEVVALGSKYGNSNVLVTKETKDAFVKMFEAAKNDGITLYVTSGYRSYNEQKEVFNEYVSNIGEKEALKYAAKPGFSEHQTGMSLDIFTPGSTTKTFKTTKASTWLYNNAYKYGFILRYPSGKENITGYSYEAWHYRYVGKKVAEEIQRLDITFDEYYEYFY